jgi:gas vesicle protein
MFVCIRMEILFTQIGQTTPTNVTPADVELLKSQLAFLKQSYGDFVETIKFISVGLGAILGVSASLMAFFFGKSYKELQDSAKEKIREIHDFSKEASQQALERVEQNAEKETQAAIARIKEQAAAEVSYMVAHEARDLIRTEVNTIARILKKEQVVNSTRVAYYWPNGGPEPKEVGLLRSREFGTVQFFTQLSQLAQSSHDVTVLDLVNFQTEKGAFSQLPKPDREAIAQPIIDELLGLPTAAPVLIVYVSYPPIDHINVVSKNRYVLAANGPITLVGNVADGAYVAKGDQKHR